MATHSSILAWEIPWTEEPGRLLIHGVAKCQILLSTSAALTYDCNILWLLKWQVMFIVHSIKPGRQPYLLSKDEKTIESSS